MKFTYLAAAALAAVFIADGAHALEFDQNVTNNVIFGSGNLNGGFTTDRANGIEIGLRGKLRFDQNNQPQNQFNSNGDGTYSFDAGTPPTGFSFDPNSPTTPVWNFEWSINSDFDGNGGALASFDYAFEIDGDPSAATDFATVFDPINSFPIADHAFGDNTTLNGAGVVAAADFRNITPADLGNYSTLINTASLAQNSSSFEFLNEPTDGLFLPQLAAFDPNEAGTYTIRLKAFEKGTSNLLAQSSIDIQVSAVPLPAAAPLYLVALASFGFLLRRRSKTA